MPLNGTIKDAQHNQRGVWATKRAKQSCDRYLKKKNLVKGAGRHFCFLKRAGRHQKGAGHCALQKRPRHVAWDCLNTCGVASDSIGACYRLGC